MWMFSNAMRLSASAHALAATLVVTVASSCVSPESPNWTTAALRESRIELAQTSHEVERLARCRATLEELERELTDARVAVAAAYPREDPRDTKRPTVGTSSLADPGRVRESAPRVVRQAIACDESHKPVVVTELIEGTAPSLIFLDANGRARLVLGIDDRGDPVIRVQDALEQTICEVTTEDLLKIAKHDW